MKECNFKFSVVIPAWRGKDFLEKNLPAVLDLSADEVIVVDASPEEDGNFVQENFPDVKVIDFKENPGFGTNMNKGIESAEGDIILMLNQDVKPSKDLLKYLKEAFEDDSVFGVSLAEQKYGPTRLVFKEGYLSHEPIEPIPKILCETMWANGGSSAIRKKYWEELDGFDEVYDPGYWEDIDLSLRAKQRGWKVLWDPRAKVVHESESSFGGEHYDQVYKRRIQERNHLIFNWKYLSMLQWPVHLFCLLKRSLMHPGYMRILWMALVRLYPLA